MGVVRAAGILLLLVLAGLSFALQEIRFAVAGAAILGLVEIGIALRVRRTRLQAVRDRSRICAARISCDEKDGALTVTLTGQGQGGGPAPYVLLSRVLQRSEHEVEASRNGPYLEMSDARASVHGGIQEAHLTPHLLRLTLNAHGAGVLRASDICVALQAPSEQRRLERALTKVLRGVPFTSDRSLVDLEATPELVP